MPAYGLLSDDHRRLTQGVRATGGTSGLTCSGADGNPTGATIYNHDDAGNMLTAIGGASTLLAGLTLDYNLPGQTTSIQAPGSTTPQPQAYDALMQDRRTQSGDTTMSYGYSGLTNQSTVPSNGTSAAHGELFVRDPAGDLIAMIDIDSGSTHAYLTDHQKSITTTINNSGGNPVRYLYEPYGQTIRTLTDTNTTDGNNGAENSSYSAPESDTNPWRYASGYFDRASGAIKYGTRYYLPGLSTWSQPDPNKGKPSDPPTLNLYLYSGNNPINSSDPTGREWYDYLGLVGDAVEVGYLFASGDVAGGYSTFAGVIVGGLFEVTCTIAFAYALPISAPGCYIAGSLVSVSVAHATYPYYDYWY